MATQKLIKLVVHTDQEAFDRAVRFFASAPRRAVNPTSNFCVYETPDGKNHCVVGSMLKLDTPEKHQWARTAQGAFSDLAYDEEWDDPAESREYLIDPNGINWELMAALQNAHDYADEWGPDGYRGWASLATIAIDFGLDTEVLHAVRR